MRSGTDRADQCQECLSWGPLRSSRCQACTSWREARGSDQNICARCRHRARVNPDGVCRACLLAIRMDGDLSWVRDPGSARPRDRQLLLAFPRTSGSNAYPLPAALHDLGAKAYPAWMRRAAVAGRPDHDDPAVCPPVIRGQLRMFDLPRHLNLAIARRIQHRPVQDYPQIQPAARAYAADHGYSQPWLSQVQLTLRMMLAVRDADGEDLVREELLDDLERYSLHLGEILRLAGQLCPRQGPPRRSLAVSAGGTRRRVIARAPARPRSCQDCGAWIPGSRRRFCDSCQRWRGAASRYHPCGTCHRCGHADIPLRDGICRGCAVHVHAHGLSTMSQTSTQLVIGSGPTLPAGRPATPPSRRQAPVSPHLVISGQGVLFTMGRDWRPVASLRRHELPALTSSAQQLVTALGQHAARERWTVAPRRQAIRTLWILVAWLGADAPLSEADVYNLARLGSNLSPLRLSQFLDMKGLLIADPARRRDSNQELIEHLMAGYPDPLAAGLRAWVKVLRGEGRRPHPPLSYRRIHRYLRCLTPVLDSWASQGISLREITRADVETAIRTRQGNPAKAIHVALRSLFRALRQERMIFHDPGRGVRFPAVSTLPAVIATSQLAGLLDQASTTMDKLIAALVAIHALTGTDLQDLQISDLDLAAGRLHVRRAHRTYTVYLDQLTLQLAATWLTERHHRWPACPNPRLLVSPRSAMDTRHPPLNGNVFRKVFKRRGLTAQQVRQDRIRDEAHATADPVHLIRVFGITASTAMRYIYAAHPERRSTMPR